MGWAGALTGIILLVLLLAAAIKGWLASQPARDGEEEATDPCPEEFVARVFSAADWEYVRGLKLGNLERSFQQERKRVARVWVRETSGTIRRVMREHAGMARRSQNLKLTTEIKVFAEFLAVLAACGILSVSIQVAGPLWLGGLARWAQQIAQQARKLQESLQGGVMVKAEGAGST